MKWREITDEQPGEGEEVLIYTGVIQRTLHMFFDGGCGWYWNSRHPDIEDCENAVNPEDQWCYPSEIDAPNK